MKRFFPLISLAALLLLGSIRSYAIPAFARKYKTSCATCHVGFPKLNAFGEAFRRSGYQFPAHTDPEFIKEDPVSLGADGNKAAFPEAIWPGSIPGSSAISLFLNGEADYNPQTDPRWTFGGMGNSIETAIGGTFGEDLSFWAQAAFSNDGVELNRIFLTFSNLVGDSYSLNARIGVFEPGLFSFSTHRAWMEGYWMTTRAFDETPGAMGWTMEETQKGIELNGICNGRFGYSAGLVEGFGNAHSSKDLYGHAYYKIGGLALDGNTAHGGAPNNAQPFLDNSFTVGAFVYSGSAVIGDTLNQANDFTVMGGDVNAWIERLNLFGAVGLRSDKQPFAGVMLTENAKTTTWFIEADYVVFPWLLPGVRVESWASQHFDPASSNQMTSFSDMQIVPAVVFLVRPNVKFTLRTALLKADPDTKFQPQQVQFMMAVGM